MHRCPSFFCLLFILLCPFTMRAQQKYIVQEYNTENGLPSNGIKGLQWDDETGFLWLATEAGIVRFNGIDFLSFARENTSLVRSERMLLLTRSHNNTIYAVGQLADVVSIRRNGIVAPQVNDYTEKRYRFWLLSVSENFANRSKPIAASGEWNMQDWNIASISDTACVFVVGGIMHYFSQSMSAPQKLFPEARPVKALFRTGDNFFIAGEANRVSVFDPLTGSARPVSIVTETGKPFGITEKSVIKWVNKMEHPIIIDEEKAWLLEWKENRLVARLIAASIPGDVLIRMAQYSKKNKILFLGTDSKGLITITPSLVEPKKRNTPSIKSRNAYYAQFELPDGNVLTNEGDIIGDQPVQGKSAPIKGKFNFTISQVQDTLYWYIVNEPSLKYPCLHRYNSHTGKTVVYPKIKLGDYVSVAASGNQIYISTIRGIAMLEADTLRYIYGFAVKPDNVYQIIEMEPGMLAIASRFGLLRLNIATATLDTLFSKDDYSVRTVKKINGYLFFGTYGAGYYMYKNGKVKPMPLDKNRYLLYTHCFVPDDGGFCWMSTNRGLFKAQLADLYYAFEHDVQQVYYQYFGRNDGMDITEMNGGCLPCALVLKNKTISFPTMDGLLWVDPKTATPVLPDGGLFIDRFTADEEAFDPGQGEVYLPANTHEVTIQVGFSAWCNRENIIIEYRQDKSKKWLPFGLRGGSTFRLTNLTPGHYAVEIRKLNGFGTNNYTYTTIEFTIITPWYNKWWFYVLVAALAAVLIWLMMRLRTRQYKLNQVKLQKQVQEKTKELLQQNKMLEKNNTIKTRLISIISHDIVTPLKFLTVGGKNLIDNKHMMPEELQDETLLEIVHTAQELQQLCTNILNWIKYQNENRQMLKEIVPLHTVVNQVVSILRSLAREKEIKLVNNVAEDLTIYQFLEPLKILVYNLVTNAINFSAEGEIHINAYGDREHITISVKDNGVGMTPEQVKNILSEQIIVSSAKMDSNRRGNGLGYLIIKDLVKMTGATLRIESKKGAGTEVFINFPLVVQS